jgi:hypothetical protein
MKIAAKLFLFFWAILWICVFVGPIFDMFSATTESHTSSVFLLVYPADMGCQEGVLYPEGGCPHWSAIVSKRFESESDAMKFLNSECAVSGAGSVASGTYLGSYDRSSFILCSAKQDIHLYHAEEIPIHEAVVGQHKETVQKQVEVVRDSTEWKVAK